MGDGEGGRGYLPFILLFKQKWGDKEMKGKEKERKEKGEAQDNLGGKKSKVLQDYFPVSGPLHI